MASRASCSRSPRPRSSTPDDSVRDALFAVVSEATLRDLVKEARANEQIFQQRVRKVIRGSYSRH